MPTLHVCIAVCNDWFIPLFMNDMWNALTLKNTTPNNNNKMRLLIVDMNMSINYLPVFHLILFTRLKM
jgi:hypothetical protein